MNVSPPVIITCLLEDNAAEYFNKLRQQYFPRAKNFLRAHLTLFHHLPLAAENVLSLVKHTTLNRKPFPLLIERIAFTGRGVAFVIKAEELLELHKNLQHTFKAVLSAQDRQGLWPHITIQNKAEADESKALADYLQKDFIPFSITANGLQLFHYLNGPWKLIDNVYFG